MMRSLQVARYRFHWRIKTSLQLPTYAGSTLRGVFGRALRKLACLTQASECRGCAVLAACPYPRLFEHQSAQLFSDQSGKGLPSLAPYAIETNFSNTNRNPKIDYRYLPGRHFSFDMVLMTPAAISQLPLIIATWKHAFANGVGKAQGTAILTLVEYLPADSVPTSTVYTEGIPRLQPHRVELSVPQFTKPTDVLLKFQTPVRIEQKGKLIKEVDLTGSLFLRHLIRRVSFHICAQQADAYSLADIHLLNTMADQVESGECQLQWHDWSRYSLRQKRSMTLGGLTGRIYLKRVPPELLPFIYLGQWTHVGKESSFGLGKYQWVASSLPPETVTRSELL